MKSYTFSIIIPTYNRAHLLPKAIQSVIEQSFTNWELIIVDDGSTDNTKEVISNFKDVRIKYIYQSNQERSAARNTGIKNATGEYICFLDSDDYYLPQRLENIHQFIFKSKEKIALFYTGICFENNGIVTPRSELKNTFENIFDFILNAIIGTPQVCVHSAILKKQQFNTQFNIGEDMELWLRIVNEYLLLYIDNEFSVTALEHDDRSVHQFYKNSAAAQVKMLEYAFTPPHSGAKASKKQQRKILSNAYFNIAKYHFYNGYKFKSIGMLLKSIFTCPIHEQTKHKVYLILTQIGIK